MKIPSTSLTAALRVHLLLLTLMPMLGFSFAARAGTTFVAIGGTPTNLFASISSNGVVTTINIDQSGLDSYGVKQAMAVDPSGNLFVAYSGDAIVKFTPTNATLIATNIGAPSSLAFDNAGNLYGNSNDCILKITAARPSLFLSGLPGVKSFCFDKLGNFYAAMGNLIYRATNGGVPVAFLNSDALSPLVSSSAFAVGVDPQLNLYVGVYGQNTNGGGYQGNVCKVSPNNAVTVVGGIESLGMPAKFNIDEKGNVISANFYYSHFGPWINGPFGTVAFPPGSGVSFNGFPVIAYTPIDEVFGTYLPSILLQPASQMAAAGTTVSFRSSATGSTPLSYQWYFNGNNQLAGATNQTLVLTNLTENQIGQYTFVVSNYLGVVQSQPASLNVIPALGIRLVPTLELYGGIGFRYNVQFINQVAPTNSPWTTLATVTLTNSPQLFPDYSAAGQPARIYRIVQLP